MPYKILGPKCTQRCRIDANMKQIVRKPLETGPGPGRGRAGAGVRAGSGPGQGRAEMSGTGPEPVLHRSGTGLGPVPDRSCIGAGPLRHWSGTGPGPIHLGNPSVYLCARLLSEAPVGTVLPKTSFKPPYAQEFLCSLTGTICRRFSEAPIYVARASRTSNKGPASVEKVAT